ncbi:DUF3833 domain-containing protein [Hwanghaeella grinnelliae]|uniref:DUF3833 domain-containing protein n=1 Tax=Hwanghaeella grinnelliae TaxID=2500179 RepID=A0A437QGK7_9PROT|nr:DUF3833 domain-containing protein [Hwanghaeella grinnelliae]RVU33689.1 DUF3833 domain-containing protein [Hwanghaeella grinnelliae]
MNLILRAFHAVSRITLGATILILAGCSNMDVTDFKNGEPTLVLEEYFDGKTLAAGLFQDRFGTVRRQFTVEIDGSWDGETLTLVEDFDYSDGETERRVWTLKKLDAHRYEGTAEGVIGTASGAAYGNAFNWVYTFDLKVGDGTWRVDFDDWMFLQPGGVLINKATVSKWGITIGEVTLSFHKPGDLRAGNDNLRDTIISAAE